MGSWLGVSNRSIVLLLATAAQPTFSPVAGSYAVAQSVAIASTDPGASIYCTVDGTAPTFPITGTTFLYTAPITVSASETIKAIGVVSGFANSATGSAGYTIGAAAFNFFISPTGSDGNLGTLASPWAITSLRDNNSNNSLIHGQRIGLLPGTYTINFSSGNNPTDFASPCLHLPAGNSSASTYLASCDSGGNYSARSAVILIPGSNTTANCLIGQDANGNGFWHIDGVVFDGGGTYPSTGGFTISLMCYEPIGLSAGQVIVENCEWRNLISPTGSGGNITYMFFDNVANAIIRNNYFHDFTHSSDPFHGHAIECYNCSGIEISHNTFVNCLSCIDFKVGDVAGNVYANYFGLTNAAGVSPIYGFDGDQLKLTNIPNVLHHNIIESNGQVRANDVSNTEILQSITWYNNTTYDIGSGAHTSLDLRCSGTGNTLNSYNNIAVMTGTSGGGGGGGYSVWPTPAWTISNYNCFAFGGFTNGFAIGYPSPTLYSSLVNFRTAPGSPDAQSISGNAAFPQFASSIVVGNGPTQYQLGGSSPCLSAGKTGGVSGGASVNMGAWDGTYAVIGADWVSYPGT